jgi:Holliday junction resolvasome RuvABC endonuclease subunit
MEFDIVDLTKDLAPAKKKRKKKIVIDSTMAETLAWPRWWIMGIDPSMASTGWALLRFNPYCRPSIVAFGNVRTDPTGDMSMQSVVRRSRQIFEGVRRVGEVYPMVETDCRVAIELPVPSARGTGSQSGSMMVCAAYNAFADVDPAWIDLYHPMHTKKVVSGDGRAKKPAIKRAVLEWLGDGIGRTNADVIDAISAAITCALEHLTEAPT